MPRLPSAIQPQCRDRSAWFYTLLLALCTVLVPGCSSRSPDPTDASLSQDVAGDQTSTMDTEDTPPGVFDVADGLFETTHDGSTESDAEEVAADTVENPADAASDPSDDAVADVAPPTAYFTTYIFTPESYLYDTEDGPHPGMPIIDCENTDAVIESCVNRQDGLQGTASCRLTRNSDANWHDANPSERFLCENSPWCSQGRSSAESTAAQRRFEDPACRLYSMHGPCASSYTVYFDESTQRWSEASLNAAGSYNIPGGAPYSEEWYERFWGFFFASTPAIGGAFCEPTLDETACACRRDL